MRNFIQILMVTLFISISGVIISLILPRIGGFIGAVGVISVILLIVSFSMSVALLSAKKMVLLILSNNSYNNKVKLNDNSVL